MKKKWTKHIGIFLFVFAICAIALYGVWRIWLDGVALQSSSHESKIALSSLSMHILSLSCSFTLVITTGAFLLLKL
jgi:predicted negative regulator of RcsB-dependent stress response